ncbi:class I SAM-dependent methyltransferase [Sphingopyxis sp.]|uniref:class I SAM-dependent methyltransferase n=1 Tax=Sphingopyxis sp. TaxID=1908224 RepID=UPI003D0D0BF2
MAIDNDKYFPAAFNDYLQTLTDLIRQYPDAKILELGGGRLPSFKLHQLPSSISTYTVNDIDPAELAMTSDDYDKACFDVVGDVSQFKGQFDVIFSRTLIEHVKDGVKMHENVVSLLKPGGVAFHLAPTLYSPPFVMNKLLPERLSQRLLYTFFPKRGAHKDKFPAYYSWCFGNRAKMTAMLLKAGFADATIRSFYGHDYFRKIPIVRQVDGAFSALAAKHDWSSFGSYAHIIARR